MYAFLLDFFLIHHVQSLKSTFEKQNFYAKLVFDVLI